MGIEDRGFTGKPKKSDFDENKNAEVNNFLENAEKILHNSNYIGLDFVKNNFDSLLINREKLSNSSKKKFILYNQFYFKQT